MSRPPLKKEIKEIILPTNLPDMSLKKEKGK
jgi:hypothetical protein